MPADYRIDVAVGCVFSSGNGILTSGELIDHQNRLRADPRFRSDLDQLADFHGLDGLNITADAILTVARGNPFGAGASRAFVVDSPLGYGLVRMFQAYTDGSLDVIEIFWDLDEAKAWLAERRPSKRT